MLNWPLHKDRWAAHNKIKLGESSVAISMEGKINNELHYHCGGGEINRRAYNLTSGFQERPQYAVHNSDSKPMRNGGQGPVGGEMQQLGSLSALCIRLIKNASTTMQCKLLSELKNSRKGRKVLGCPPPLLPLLIIGSKSEIGERKCQTLGAWICECMFFFPRSGHAKSTEILHGSMLIRHASHSVWQKRWIPCRANG